MIPAPTIVPSSRMAQADAPQQEFLWIDQFSTELLLTVQALQQLHAALQNKMLGK